MKLGIVMTGTGALAAACVGVMQEIEQRRILPCAVCGMETGVWPAAMYMDMQDANSMHAALVSTSRMGRRMLKGASGTNSLLRQKRTALIHPHRIERLLVAHAGQNLLGLCRKPGILLCRMAQSARTVAFSTRAYSPYGDALVSMQASVSFAARACMSLPPFLEPVQWMGSALIAHDDEYEACMQLLALGAQRVLVIRPRLSSRRVPDALDLTEMALEGRTDHPLPPGTAVLRVVLSPGYGALSADRLLEIAQEGRETARRELDHALSLLGMGHCRVLPFRNGCAGTGSVRDHL